MGCGGTEGGGGTSCEHIVCGTEGSDAGEGERGGADGDGVGEDEGSGDTDGGGEGDDGGAGGCELGATLDAALWDELFPHRGDPACSGEVYTRQGLLDAAADFPGFACTGDTATRRRELAAFLAQISHETTGGWATAPGGPYAWGLCFVEEVGCEVDGCPQYCQAGNVDHPCVPGQSYHGRGAIQLSWNYNYGLAGDELGVDLLADPDLVREDSKLAVQTALWFWMRPQAPKPSAHAVMVGEWVPTAQDEQLGRFPGFGMTTNIINGGLECNMPGNDKVADRIGFFERYAALLETTTGEHVDCDTMQPYG